MRLRYLHVKGLPPLNDITIPFNQENILSRKLAIRFVVGVNGTGKTRLLQSLTEVFLALAQGRQPLPFPVTLAYDLGEKQSRTIFLHYPGEAHSNTSLIEFEKILPADVDWPSLEDFPWEGEAEPAYRVQNRFAKGTLPSATSIIPFLPVPILVYTSGYTSSWEALFVQTPNEVDLDPSRLNPQDELIQERPASWSLHQEQDYQHSIDGTPPPDRDESSETFSTSQIATLLTGSQIKLAACAVTIFQAIRSWNPNLSPADERLSQLLNEVGWKEPVAVNLKLSLRQDLRPGDAAQLYDLFSVASVVLSVPEPGETRHLTFDLRHSLSDKLELRTIKVGEPRLVVQALFEVLGGENPSPFEVFRTLQRWQQGGILQDIEIALQHHSIEGLLLYDWLSDGERMFLGRIALFYLLQNQQDAMLILDEPETHFNDTWKRQVVDIVDGALGEQANEVVISTHSSIALTDVFDTEITLLRKNSESQTVALVRTPIQTFGASPNEIMRDVFGTDETVGQRASEYLDMVLMLSIYAERVEEVWQSQQNILQNQEFSQLWMDVKEYWPNYKKPEELAKLLVLLKQFAQGSLGKSEVVFAEVLDTLQKRVGPGYYQFEFRRRLRAMGTKSDDVA